ncbi:hypothetical protein N7478_001908 [Penicillium angulare]|uniref:uncharacterized protein n=1 Tax=Penicillium angulare TaxID=116970 RepID=UPI0025408E06|nr:uncharacterized protein N7478_001908 [Penicillium angulare]KAJ5288878.1 hypothetical protein N7478_001908 [Penicillium angulare]
MNPPYNTRDAPERTRKSHTYPRNLDRRRRQPRRKRDSQRTTPRKRQSLTINSSASWFDYGRDTIHMISQFRSEMPRPIIGISHSAGAVQLIFASLYNKRLFHFLILIEPFIIEGPAKGGGLMPLETATKKPDTWLTRDEAIEKSPHLRSWDKRTLQRWKEYGYRTLPCTSFPSDTDGVTTTTTKHQETMTYTSIHPSPKTICQYPTEQEGTNPERQIHRIESVAASKLVAHLRPNTLFAGTHIRAAQKTGTGFGGSGSGAAHAVLEKAGRSAPLEKVGDTAEAMGVGLHRKWQNGKKRKLGFKKNGEIFL